jgi:hypothetical protein
MVEVKGCRPLSLLSPTEEDQQLEPEVRFASTGETIMMLFELMAKCAFTTGTYLPHQRQRNDAISFPKDPADKVDSTDPKPPNTADATISCGLVLIAVSTKPA